MWLFWFLAVILVTLTLWFLLHPLWRKMSSGPSPDGEKRLSVYQQQFQELEQDLKSGSLTDEDYQQAKEELERRLLDEESSMGTEGQTGMRVSNRILIGSLLVLFPMVSVGLYYLFGNPLAIIHPSTPLATNKTATVHKGAGGLESVTEGLKRKLAKNPEDGEGWALLAHSYVELRHHTEAVPAFEKAVDLIPQDAQLLADYADALAMVHGRKLQGKPALLIRHALEVDSQNVKALLLSATLDFQEKEYAQAINVWERLLADTQTDLDLRQELQSNIAEAKGLLGGNISTVVRRPTFTVSPASHTIRGTVTLGDKLSDKASATDTLFVFARAVTGPPMPVAIVRATRNDLPFTFQLDDSQSLMPTMKLSQAGEVLVVARLSRSGDASPKPGDLQGQSLPVKPGTSGLTIVIDSEVP